MSQNRLSEAEYREAVAQDALNHKAWYGLGLCLKDMKRYPEAADAILEAVRIQEDNFYYRNVLVSTLWLAGKEDEAVKQGYLCLALKDRIAVDKFKSSAYADLSVKSRHPLFDYKKKKSNIIAFSLWGDDPVYVTGALINAQLIPHMYDGWTARFYCDASVSPQALDALRKLDAQVVMIEDERLKKFRSMWRFLVMDDPGVEYFLCRDTDSRVNVQEVVAVQEWLYSDKKFHIMRDHPYHVELILAGMWGGVAGVLPNIQEILLESGKYGNNPLFDQVFLMEVVWPLIKQDVLVHDSYYAFPDGKDFPKAFRLPPGRHVGGGIKQIPENQQNFFKDFYLK